MTKEQYLDFCLRYRGCGACFPIYEKLNRFEKLWFTAIQKDYTDLEKENAELKSELHRVSLNEQLAINNGKNFLKQIEELEEELRERGELLEKVKPFLETMWKNRELDPTVKQTVGYVLASIDMMND